MPDRETVKKAIAAIKTSADYEYFFDALGSPVWIEPLSAEGFFAAPPPAVREAEWVRYPAWPESRYLARMAGLAPETVLTVLLDVPQTDNARVKDDIIDAALAMPAPMAARLVPLVASWADEPLSILLPDKIAQLAARLAQAGLVAPAAELTVTLLTPVGPDTPQDADSADEGWREPRPRIRAWDYGEAIKTVMAPLVGADAAGAVTLFAGLLDAAVSVRMGDRPPPRDHSYVWRPAVEDSGQNHAVDEVTDLLVEAVRDAAERAVAEGLLPVGDLVAILESQRWRIHHRVALHVVRVNLDLDFGLARDRALETHRGDDLDQYHEFWLLVRDVFPRLAQAEQQAIVDHVLAGPREAHGEDPEGYARVWSLRRLAILKDVLGPRWRPSYDELVASAGFEPEHSDFISYMSSWSGPTSPKETADLLAMPVEEVVEYLREWRAGPEDRFMGPSPEGLGRSLSAAVTADPERFAHVAELFTAVEPTYVRSAVQGWRSAIAESRPFSWAPVIALCRWAAHQEPAQGGEDAGGWDRDPNWQWTRRAVADLLGSGLEHGSCEIPSDLRDAVWSVLEPLTRDPDPTPSHERQYGRSNMDPPTLAINTTRGEALHTVVRYALWVHRHMSAKTGEEPSTFDAMPEVRAVLEEHLRPEIDPSPAVRSAYGQWLPWLVLLDRGWAQEHVAAIFTEEPGLEHLRDAAWDAYVRFCTPYDSVFEILGAEYLRAAERLAREASPEVGPHSSEARLAEHVMVLVLRGRVGLDHDLVTTLFSASEDVRARAVAFVGRAMRAWEDAAEPIVERARGLWQARRAAARTDEPGYRKELAAFGWWFVSARFGPEWEMEHLVEVLRATGGRIDLDFTVMKRLAELAPNHPAGAVEAVRLIADAGHDGWGLAGSIDTVRTILAAALAAPDAGARESATALVHHLGARGYRELRDLLRSER